MAHAIKNYYCPIKMQSYAEKTAFISSFGIKWFLILVIYDFISENPL